MTIVSLWSLEKIKNQTIPDTQNFIPENRGSETITIKTGNKNSETSVVFPCVNTMYSMIS